MPPIFDDYGDENNNDSYFVEFAPATINENDYVYVALCFPMLVALCFPMRITMIAILEIALVLLSYACCFVLS
jgi:hypothetical protein